MRQSPLDNLRQQADLNDMRQNSRKIVLLLPTLVEGAFDADMQSGLNVSSGDGTGRTATWVAYELFTFVQRVTQNLITFGQVPTGVEVGDVVFHTQMKDDEVIVKAYANPYHYIWIDGETFRIASLAYSDTGRNQARVCGCIHFTPSVFRCKGY